MSEQQKARRAKRLLSMVEQEREKARAELAQTNQRLSAAEEERRRAEARLHEDHRGAGRGADWVLADLDHEHSRRALKKAVDVEKKAADEVAVAEQKATAAHQKHRVFERFHDNIHERIEQTARRKEAVEADAFALVMWSKKQSGEGDAEDDG
jgi:chromosome segregation ATPase